MDRPALIPQSALQSVAIQGSFGARGATAVGVTIRERRGLQIRHVVALTGYREDVIQRLSSLTGEIVRDTPMALHGRGVSVVGVGPGAWFCLSDTALLAQSLEESVIGPATVTDHSAAKVVLRLSGPNVRDALAKGCPIDLDPTVFGPGAAATTQIDQFVCQIWRSADHDTFDIMVPRSPAISFWSWLTQSSAEFGYDVLEPEQP